MSIPPNTSGNPPVNQSPGPQGNGSSAAVVLISHDRCLMDSLSLAIIFEEISLRAIAG